MTVVLDWKTADQTVPDTPAYCTMCGESVYRPLCTGGVRTVTSLFAPVLSLVRHGLTADMARAIAIDGPEPVA